MIKYASKIRILDSGNNQVKIWNSPKFNRGLFEDRLQLTDAEPGTWKIVVEADGDVNSSTGFFYLSSSNIKMLL